MQTVVVTGVAGFIGSNTAEKLLQENPKLEIIGIDNLDPYYSVEYKKENLAILKRFPNFTFYKADIRNKKRMQEIFNAHRPDGVLHIAAKADTRHAVAEPEEYLSVNVMGTLNLLECAKDHTVKRFVFISSGSVYGNKNKPPYAENAQTDYSLSPYGASKKAGEVLTYTYTHNFGLPVICLRVFNAYGKRMRPGLVLYRWTEAILAGTDIEMSGTGTRKRNYTYIDDLVRAIILALNNTKIEYDIINVGNPDTTSLKQLLNTLQKVTGKKAVTVSRPSSHASTEASYVSVQKAKKLLGWSPSTSLTEGVEEFVLWFKNERIKDR